jgi:hypothetical protein
LSLATLIAAIAKLTTERAVASLIFHAVCAVIANVNVFAVVVYVFHIIDIELHTTISMIAKRSLKLSHFSYPVPLQ